LQSHFADALADAVKRTQTPVVVGIDPHWEQLPAGLRPVAIDAPAVKAAAVRQFSAGVIDVVAPLVPAVKVQAAFFEEIGPAGMAAMADVIAHAQAAGLLVIVDGKRNDIGNTAAAYARGYLGRQAGAWHADAVTVSPYLGEDSLTPFVDVARERGAGLFVLVKTSNPGGRMFQDVMCDGKMLYRRVAEHVEQLAAATAGNCGYGSVGAVVGATYPDQLAELRAAMPHAWFLVPGYGSQGGTAADVAAALDARGQGAVVNNSRGIIFAHARPEFAQRFGAGRWQEAIDAATRQMIEDLRTAVPTIS
jgi:orotidine-5'-phosphate decarboxylase